MAMTAKPESCPNLKESASVAVLDYDALEAQEAQSIESLSQAVKTNGVFYLKLHDILAARLFVNANELFDCSQELFHLPVAEKAAFDIDQIGSHKIDG